MKNLLPQDIEGIIQDAIHEELLASSLYKHIANQLQRLGYFGAAKFFRSESEDELKHYQGHVDFLNDMGSVAKVPMVEAIKEPIASLKDALQSAYDTETQLMQDYADWWAECSARHPISAQFLLEYLAIQRKSVGEYGDLLSRLNLAGDNQAAIMLLDQEMGE